MKFLGFYPESIAARARAAAAPPRLLTLGQSLGLGAGGFCLIIMIVIGILAAADQPLKKHLGDKGAHAVYALLFILMAGGLFRKLIIPPAPVLRVYVLFAATFFLYAAAWMATYSPFRNIFGEWLGALAGGTGSGLVLATAFDAPKQALRIILVLCITSATGYFGVKWLYPFIPGIVGAFVCGATYGLVMGTGLGCALYACQEPARERLKTVPASGGRPGPLS